MFVGDVLVTSGDVLATRSRNWIEVETWLTTCLGDNIGLEDWIGFSDGITQVLGGDDWCGSELDDNIWGCVKEISVWEGNETEVGGKYQGIEVTLLTEFDDCADERNLSMLKGKKDSLNETLLTM